MFILPPFFIFFTEAEGKALETELNEKGPGEALFVFCDVTKEEDIKVVFILYWFHISYLLLCIRIYQSS